MIDKGQWGEFGQDNRVTPLLFTRSAMGFLMTTDSQNCLSLVLLDNNTPTQDGTKCFYGVLSVLELNICDYHELLLNGKQLSKNIPICMTLPNTEELSTVLQFQQRLRNWY